MSDKTKIILLADDDPEDQELLEDIMLKMEPSIRFKKVDSGKQAVDYLEACADSELPCSIILDYSMPIYNAAEVLELINHHPRLSAIPRVVWSSSKQPEHVKTCMDRGAMAYFVKPNKMSELTSIARKMLDITFGVKTT
jgi:CheY-like chemotaxis protein